MGAEPKLTDSKRVASTTSLKSLVSRQSSTYRTPDGRGSEHPEFQGKAKKIPGHSTVVLTGYGPLHPFPADYEEDEDYGLDELEPGGKVRGVTITEPNFVPVDGGFHAWLVCFASFWANGTLFSSLNVFGVWLPAIVDLFDKSNPPLINATSSNYMTTLRNNMSTTLPTMLSTAAGSSGSSWGMVTAAPQDKQNTAQAALVGSLNGGFTFGFSFVVGILANQFGLRPIAFTGSLIAFGAYFTTSFMTEPWGFFLFYSALMGIGASMVYTPSIEILNHYFDKRLGIVNGIVACGSAVFSFALPYIVKGIVESIGIGWGYRIISSLYAILIFLTLAWVPKRPKPVIKGDMTVGKYIRGLCDFSIWRNANFVIWISCLGGSMVGYFVMFVYLVDYVDSRDYLHGEGELLLMMIQVGSLVGRLVGGKLADIKRINRLRLQQSAIIVMSATISLVPLYPEYWLLIINSLVFGFMDGCYVCLIGTIAVELVEPHQVGRALGFLFALFAIPISIGSVLAGLLYDEVGNYDIPFHIAGAPGVLAGLCMFFIRPKTGYCCL